MRGEKLTKADPEMLLPAGVPRMLCKRPQGLLIFSFSFELHFLTKLRRFLCLSGEALPFKASRASFRSCLSFEFSRGGEASPPNRRALIRSRRMAPDARA